MFCWFNEQNRNATNLLQFKNTKGYGYNVEEWEAYDKYGKDLLQNKLNYKTIWFNYSIIAIDEYSEKPIQHTGNISLLDVAKSKLAQLKLN
jgi:hypothetical protein